LDTPQNQSRRRRVAGLAIVYLCAVLVVAGNALAAITNSLFAHFSALPVALSFLLGLAFGAVLVRAHSRIAVELGWVPSGFLILAISCVVFWFARASYPLLVLGSGVLGMASAFTIFPLHLYLSTQGRPKTSTASWVSIVSGLLLGFAITTLPLRAAPVAGTLLWAGLATVLFTLCLFVLDREFLIRGGLFLGGRLITGVRIVGQHNVPATGGALLVSNHVTFIDGFLIGSSLPRLVRYMIFKPYFELPVARWVCTTIRAIPTSETGPREVVASLKRARAALLEGDLVCIFAEGFITRTGALLPFKRGMDRIVAGTDIPIIPVHLDGLYGRTLSLVDGKLVRRWPQRARVPVTISFGTPLPPGATAEDARAAVEQLASAAGENRTALERPPVAVA
jgi:acyl-[acyl-carrier-protein]-phospholipid O-acyltransferase / long-chain-fatty-acid--[acyl-carrier-protein] ligase